MDCFAKNMGSQTHVFLAEQLSPTIQRFRNIASHCPKYGPNRYAENTLAKCVYVCQTVSKAAGPAGSTTEYLNLRSVVQKFKLYKTNDSFNIGINDIQHP